MPSSTRHQTCRYLKYENVHLIQSIFVQPQHSYSILCSPISEDGSLWFLLFSKLKIPQKYNLFCKIIQCEWHWIHFFTQRLTSLQAGKKIHPYMWSYLPPLHQRSHFMFILFLQEKSKLDILLTNFICLFERKKNIVHEKLLTSRKVFVEIKLNFDSSWN